MGNLDALRDWGHAKDYVRMQWMMLQQDQPDDFVIATGKQYSVRQFIEWTAAELGMQLRWDGQGVNELGYWVNRHSREGGNPGAPEGMIGVEKDTVLPSLRTVRAVFPHTALQSVVSSSGLAR